MTINDLAGDISENDLAQMYSLISNHKENFNYLKWSKEKEEGKNVKTTSYHRTKNACSSKPKEFLKKWKEESESQQIHTIAQISQFKHIKEIREIVSNPENKAKFIWIDWCENVDLYQTRQEKSQYYTSFSTSVNMAVLYESSGTTSHGTISNVKSHKASVTWASRI